MSEVALLDPPAEAIDATPDEATPVVEDKGKGTADDGVTVQPGDRETGDETPAEEPAAPELKHSDERLTAEVEKARDEGAKNARDEHVKASKDHATAMLDLVTARNGTPSKVMQAAANEAQTLELYDSNGDRLTKAEAAAVMEPVLKILGDATSVHLEGAKYLAVQGFRNAQARMLGIEPDKYDAWAESKGIDPTMDYEAITRAMVDELASKSDAVTGMDAETALKTIKSLKTHFAKERDDAYAKGRVQGRKDPVGARGSGGESTPDSTVHDAAWASTAPIAEVTAWLKTQQQ